MKTKYCLFLIILLMLPMTSVSAIRPHYVYDTADVVSDAMVSMMNEFGNQVDSATTAEVVVVTLQKLPDGKTVEETKLYYYNDVSLDGVKGVGKAGKDNGVVILLVMDTHDIAIETGYGVEGQLTDAECGRIIRDVITPYLKDGKFGEGLYYGMKAVGQEIGFVTSGTISDTTGIGTTTAEPTVFDGLGFNMFWIFIIVAVIVIILALLCWIDDGSGNSFATGSHSSGHSNGGGFGGGGSGGGGAGGHWNLPPPIIPIALVGVAAFLAGEKKLAEFLPDGNQTCPKCEKETSYYKDKEYTSRDIRGDGVFDVITTSCLCLVCGNVYATSLDKLIMSHAEYLRRRAEEAERDEEEDRERARRRKRDEEDSARRKRSESSSYHSPSSSPSSFGGGGSGGGGARGKW